MASGGPLGHFEEHGRVNYFTNDMQTLYIAEHNLLCQLTCISIAKHHCIGYSFLVPAYIKKQPSMTRKSIDQHVASYMSRNTYVHVASYMYCFTDKHNSCHLQQSVN